MVKVEFLGPIKRDSLSIEATMLSEVANILNQDNELKEWLQNAAVAVNDKITKDIDTPLKDGDKISILPPVCGG